MKILWKMSLCVLFVLSAATADAATAAKIAAIDICQQYGYVPHSRDYAACRMNVWHYWSTGPCGDSAFAFTHRGYCHLYPPLDF